MPLSLRCGASVSSGRPFPPSWCRRVLARPWRLGCGLCHGVRSPSCPSTDQDEDSGTYPFPSNCLIAGMCFSKISEAREMRRTKKNAQRTAAITGRICWAVGGRPGWVCGVRGCHRPGPSVERARGPTRRHRLIFCAGVRYVVWGFGFHRDRMTFVGGARVAQKTVHVFYHKTTVFYHTENGIISPDIGEAERDARKGRRRSLAAC